MDLESTMFARILIIFGHEITTTSDVWTTYAHLGRLTPSVESLQLSMFGRLTAFWTTWIQPQYHLLTSVGVTHLLEREKGSSASVAAATASTTTLLGKRDVVVLAVAAAALPEDPFFQGVV